MHNLKTLLLRALVASSLFAGAGYAVAGPAYHVTIDTHTLPSAGGYVDFLFAGVVSSATPTATISNAMGAFDAGNAFAYGSPQGSLASALTLSNFDEFGEWAQFGGILSFDVHFAGIDTPGANGMDLSVALLDANQWDYAAGTSGNVVTFSLLPGGPNTYAVDASLATAVPEPATLAQMASGFALLAGALRRRRNKFFQKN